MVGKYKEDEGSSILKLVRDKGKMRRGGSIGKGGGYYIERRYG